MADKSNVPPSIWASYIKGESAYESAIRLGKIPATMTESEWVDSLAGQDGVVQSIQAGTLVTVDNTDPANPIVSVTLPSGGTSGGGGLTLTSLVTPSYWYSSPYAALCNILMPLRDVNISGLEFQLSNGVTTGASYKAVAVRFNPSTKYVYEVHETEEYTLSGLDDFNTGKNVSLMFSAPVLMTRADSVAGNQWAIIVIRTDGTTTSANSIGYSISNPSQQWQFFRFISMNSLAINASPIAGANLTLVPVSGHLPFILFASLP